MPHQLFITKLKVIHTVGEGQKKISELHNLQTISNF